MTEKENIIDLNEAASGVESEAPPPENLDCAVEADEARRLRVELDDWRDKYVHALADCDNEKRRTMLDAKNMVESRLGAFAADMLPLADNLAIAMASIRGSVDEAVMTGLTAIVGQFESALAKNGVTRINTVGEPLNPKEHQVVAQEEGDHPSGTVIRELAAGYKIGERTLREAIVVTAK